MDKKQELIKQCRYYRGERENPFVLELEKHEVDKSHLKPPESMYTEYHGLKEEDLNKLLFSVNFWEYERYWVDFQQNNRELLKNEEGEYRRFVLPHFALDDGVPLSLKAILFNRFAHWHSGYGDVIQEFKKWYANY